MSDYPLLTPDFIAECIVKASKAENPSPDQRVIAHLTHVLESNRRALMTCRDALYGEWEQHGDRRAMWKSIKDADDALANTSDPAVSFPVADLVKKLRDMNDWVLDCGCARYALGVADELEKRAAEGRPDAEAIAAAPTLKGKKAVVLYFETEQNRDELVALIQEAKPGMRAVNL